MLNTPVMPGIDKEKILKGESVLIFPLKVRITNPKNKKLRRSFMNKKAAIIAGVAIVGLLGAFALTGKKDSQETAVKGTEVVTVQDENGTIEVAKNPERVVTFDYGTLDILDNMGSEELADNIFRIAQTDAKLKRDNVDNEYTANSVHYEVGREVRNSIKRL